MHSMNLSYFALNFGNFLVLYPTDLQQYISFKVFPEVLHLTSMNHCFSESPYSSLLLQPEPLVRVSCDNFGSVMLFLIP